MKKILYITSVLLIVSTAALHAGYLESGKSYYMYKKYDKAMEMLRKAAETGDHGDAYYFMGEIEKNRGNYQEAVNHFKNCVKKKNTTRKYLKNAYWDILLLEEQRGNTEGVTRICKEMWHRLGDYSAKKKIESMINKSLWTENQTAISEYNEGISLRDSGRGEEAAARFRSALRTDPSFLAPKFELGLSAYKSGRLDEAASYMGEIASRINFYGEVHLILGDIYYRKKNYQAAASNFERVFDFGMIDKETEYETRIKSAECLYATRSYDRSAEDADRALSIKPGSVRPMLILSAVRIKQGDYDAALKILNRANSINPDSRQIHFQMGSIYYKKGDPKYINHFDKLHDLAKNKKTAKYTRVFTLLASAHYDKKNYRRSSEIISSIPEKSLNSEICLIGARAAYMLGEYEKSVRFYEKCSPSGDDRLMFAKACARSGNMDRARTALANFLYDEAFMKKAKSDPDLSVIAEKLEHERPSRSNSGGPR